MAVTEYATLHSTAGNLTPELRDTLIRGYKIQDEWCAKNQPELAGGRAGFLFQQAEDPAVVLLTARWPSIAAHWQWIGTDENKRTMEELMGGGQIITEGDKKVVLFHLDAEVFTECQGSQGEEPAYPAAAQPTRPLESSPIISVGRMYVPSGKREAFERKFEEARGILEDFARPWAVRGGWRLDKEEAEADRDEFLLFCGWESVERHMEFAKSPDFPRYRELSSFTERVEIKHYRRFL